MRMYIMFYTNEIVIYVTHIICCFFTLELFKSVFMHDIHLCISLYVFTICD